MRRGTFWSPVPPGTVAVVGLPRPDEKSLAGTRCSRRPYHLDDAKIAHLSTTRMFRPGVRELSGLEALQMADSQRCGPRAGARCRPTGTDQSGPARRQGISLARRD